MSATPRRRFWLLCALVLPIVNVPVVAAFLFASGGTSTLVAATAVAGELALLGRLLSRDGLEGGPLVAWLVAGTASTAAATFASCIAAFFVWLAVVSSQCPAGGYECPF
jgi:hypothetical protein